jgi:hypothetical protein
MDRLITDAREVLFFADDRAQAQGHADALVRDAALRGVDPVAHAAEVFAWIEAIFESGADIDRDHTTLLRMQEGAALVIVDV